MQYILVRFEIFLHWHICVTSSKMKNRLMLLSDLRLHLKSNYTLKTGIDTYIEKNKHIKVYNIPFLSNNMPTKLYQDINVEGGLASAFDVALSLKKNSFLTGYYVMSLNGWTEYIPKVIHVNWKRNPFQKKDSLIDNNTLQMIAFREKQTSKLRFNYNKYEIVILNGQVLKKYKHDHFKRIDKQFDLPSYAETYIDERLIIEALINYHYFGGADIVWNAGKNQFNNLDLDLMLAIYKEMELIYPYANAIGYWLERSGVSSKYISKWVKLVNHDLQFHLFMGDKERRVFNDKWNLYIPKRFI